MHYGSIIDRGKGAGGGGDSSSSTFERYFLGGLCIICDLYLHVHNYVHVPELCVKNVIMIQQQVHQLTTIVNQILPMTLYNFDSWNWVYKVPCMASKIFHESPIYI